MSWIMGVALPGYGVRRTRRRLRSEHETEAQRQEKEAHAVHGVAHVAKDAAVEELSPVHSPLPRPSMESSIRPLLDTEPSLNT